MKKREVLRGGSAFALGVLALGLSATTAVGQVFAANPTSKVYGTDAFDTNYSKGVLFRDPTFDAAANPMKVILPGDGIPSSEMVGIENQGNRTCYNNAAKGQYVEIKNGAIYNGEYLDVREYVWVEGSASLTRYWCYKNPNSDGSVNTNSGSPTAIMLYRGAPALGMENVSMTDIANIEMHFYNKSGNEVEFHGVVGMNDFEVGEQYKLVQGGGQVYLRQPTLLSYIEANGAWGVNPIASTNSTNGQYDLWVEVDGTKSNPLRLQYISEGSYQTVGHYRVSAMMMEAVNVKYQIVGDAPSGTTAPANDIVTQYGKIAPASAKSVDGYTFDGWYYDQALTNKVGTITDKINSNTTLYGKYVKDEEESSDSGTKTPDTGLFTGESGFSKFGGAAAVAGVITAGLTGYVVYKNRKHLFKKIGFGKKGF